MTLKTTGYRSPIAIHPGETLKEILETLDMTQKDLSIRTGLAEKTISEIIQAKNPVTLETALKFERVLGTSKDFWINYQAGYDADVLRIEQEEQLQREVEMLPKFPYAELKKLKYVRDVKDKVEKVEELLRFFSVNSLAAVKETLAPAFNISFRKSDKKNLSKEALASWLRIGQIEAKEIEVQDYDEKKLKENINNMRALTTTQAEYFSRELKRLCAACGIALIYTPYLKNTYVNGATRWLSPKKALIQVSLRNKYSDIFWFTFFHEIGHILKHHKKETFIDLKDMVNKRDEEREADDFAENTLIPKKRFQEFLRSLTDVGFHTKIKQFADEMSIDAGIVAGRVGKQTNDWQSVAQYRKQLQFAESA